MVDDVCGWCLGDNKMVHVHGRGGTRVPIEPHTQPHIQLHIQPHTQPHIQPHTQPHIQPHTQSHIQPLHFVEVTLDLLVTYVSCVC